MENLILVLHVLVAVAIIVLIMLQQGKGAEMGASFGGGTSQTVFGAAGAGNFFSRLTAIGAAVFFITSFSLAIVAKNKSEIESAGFAVPDSVETAESEAALEGVDGAAEKVEDAEALEVEAALEGGGLEVEVSGDAAAPAIEVEVQSDAGLDGGAPAEK